MTREEALEELDCLFVPDDQPELQEAMKMAIEALEQQPEIIRCKDCKQFRKWVDIDFTFCDLTESPVFETDFCSRAESEEV